MKERIWIGRDEAAQIIGCTPQTISNYVTTGLVVSKNIKGRVLIDRRTLKVAATDLSEIYKLGQQIEKAKRKLADDFITIDNEQKELYRTIGLMRHSIVNQVNKRFILEMLEVNCLVPREKEIMRQLLDGYTLDYVGSIHFLTRERVRQIAERASRKLFVNITRYRKLIEEHNNLEQLNMELTIENDRMKEAIKLQQKEIEDNKEIVSSEEANILGTPIYELDLSVRALNCLKAAEIGTFGQLIRCKREDLLRLRNFGRRTLVELDELVRSKGYDFGYVPQKQ